MSCPISVLLVDDNPTFLRIVERYLQQIPGIEVVGSASSGEEALEAVSVRQPQVVLIDLEMPGVGGLATIPRLRALMPEGRIIALTFHDAVSYRDAALGAGAHAFLSKRAMNLDLIPAIQNVAAQNPASADGPTG